MKIKNVLLGAFYIGLVVFILLCLIFPTKTSNRTPNKPINAIVKIDPDIYGYKLGHHAFGPSIYSEIASCVSLRLSSDVKQEENATALIIKSYKDCKIPFGGMKWDTSIFHITNSNSVILQVDFIKNSASNEEYTQLKNQLCERYGRCSVPDDSTFLWGNPETENTVMIKTDGNLIQLSYYSHSAQIHQKRRNQL